MILAGDQDMHTNLDEFKFGQDLKTDCRVSCPIASKNQCLYLFLLLLIQSFLNLNVMRTCIMYLGRISNFSTIGPSTT